MGRAREMMETSGKTYWETHEETIWDTTENHGGLMWKKRGTMRKSLWKTAENIWEIIDVQSENS